MMAQATGAWLISLGVAAGHALLERDARRLRPAATGYILLAVLLSVALARYPHLFEWRSVSGIAYLIFLVTMLLTGPGRPGPGEGDEPVSAPRRQQMLTDAFGVRPLVDRLPAVTRVVGPERARGRDGGEHPARR